MTLDVIFILHAVFMHVSVIKWRVLLCSIVGAHHPRDGVGWLQTLGGNCYYDATRMVEQRGIASPEPCSGLTCMICNTAAKNDMVHLFRKFTNVDSITPGMPGN